MFLHLYKYRLLSFFRSKTETFWTMIFPIILVTCFSVAFSNISKKAYVFHSIPVAIVYENENEMFRSVVNELADDNSEGENFLKITETDIQTAEELLESDDVDVIITVDDSIHMTVDSTGLNQTAVESFINTYLQKESVYKTLVADNNYEALQLLTEINSEVNCIKEENLVKDNPDSMISYYFSLIAMAILFGGYFGSKCGREMNANTTNKGLRKCISSVPKFKFIIAEFLATITLHIISLLVLLLYMVLVLRLNIGNQFGYIALTCIVGSLCGVSSGIFVGSLPFSEDTQTTIVTLFSLVSSFLSGLMVHVIKIYIEHYAPIVNKLNPATIIQDSLYSLLVYNTHERYFQNMIILFIYSIIMCLASFIMTRRTKYANI